MAEDIVLVLRVDDKGTRVIQSFSAKGEKAFKGLDKSVKRSGRNLDAIAGKLKNVGRSLTMRMTLPLAGIGAAALKMSMDFNQSMANIATLIPGEIKRVRKLKTEVQDLAMAYGASTKDISFGLYQVISAGYDAADQVGVLDIAVKAAAAGMATTTDAINLLSAVTKGYGDTTTVAVQKTADLAFLTVKLGQTTFPELAKSIGRVVPIASKLNIKEEEMFAIFATLTGVTGQAAEVSTQFAGILRGMMKPTDTMSGLIEDLGFATSAAMVKELGLVDAMRALEAKTDGTAESVAKLLPRAEALVGWFALTGAQAETFNEKLAAMGDFTGVLDDAFKEMSEGINKTGFSFQQLKQHGVVLMQTIGDALAPALGKLIGQLKPLIIQLIGFVNKIAEAPGFIRVLVGGVGALLVALGPLFMIISRVLWGIGQFKKFEVAAKSVKILTKAVKGLKAMSALTTVGLGVLLAALALTVYWTEKVRKAQKELIEAEKRVNEQAQTQAVRWALVAKEAGLTTGEMMRMTAAYKGNYSQMFRALKLGKETVELQEAYIRVIKILKGELKEMAPEVQTAMDAQLKLYREGKYEVDAMIESIQFYIKAYEDAERVVPKTLTSILEKLKDERASLAAAAKAKKDAEVAWKSLVESYTAGIPTVGGVKLQFDALQEVLKKVAEKGGNVRAAALALKDKITELYEEAKIAKEIFGDELPEGLEDLKLSLETVTGTWASAVFGIVKFTFEAARAAKQVRDLKLALDVPAPTPWVDQRTGLEKFADKLKDVSKLVGTVTQAWDAMWNQMYNNQIARIDNEYERRRQVIDASMMSDQEKYFAVEKLEREMEQRRLKALRRQAMATKASGIIESIINTAVGVTAALKVADIPLAIFIGIMGAIQTALIAAQPIPAMAQGGIIGLHGPEVFLGGEKGPEVVRPLAEDRRLIGAGAARSVTATFNANFYISSPDTLGWQRITREKIAPEFIEWVRLNKAELLAAMEE